MWNRGIIEHFQFNIDFVILGSFLLSKKVFSYKPRHRFAYQWMDNLKINKYAKFYHNIPCGSIVISIYNNRTDAQQSLLHQKRLSRMPVVRQCYQAYVKIQNLLKIYHEVKSYEHFY